MYDGGDEDSTSEIDLARKEEEGINLWGGGGRQEKRGNRRASHFPVYFAMKRGRKEEVRKKFMLKTDSAL